MKKLFRIDDKNSVSQVKCCTRSAQVANTSESFLCIIVLPKDFWFG